MKILIIFETVEGHTRKVVEFVEDRLRDKGHTVQLFNAEDQTAPLSFAAMDKIILAAPVHERRHPRNFEMLITASKEDLEARPSLFISVSLKASFAEGLDEAQDYLTEMEMRTGFKPTRELLVAGAVRTESYGYFEQQVIRNVVLNGREIELVDGVREFTDWDALGQAIDAFL